MSDGAHSGIKAHAALHAILGGEAPDEGDVFADAVTFADWIRGGASLGDVAEWPDADAGYTETSRRVAKRLVAFLEAHPEHRRGSGHATYEYCDPHDPRIVRDFPEVRRRDGQVWALTAAGWDDLMTPDLTEEERQELAGISGFMWGWAVNAARRVLALPPVGNPALLTVDSDATNG